VRQKYPEKAKELGFASDSWFNGLAFLRGLLKQDDTGDTELVRLKTLVRHTIKYMLLCMLAGFLLPFITVIIIGFSKGLYEGLNK